MQHKHEQKQLKKPQKMIFVLIPPLKKKNLQFAFFVTDLQKCVNYSKTPDRRPPLFQGHLF